MFKVCFLGAGSTIFAKNVLGDCILTPSLGKFEIALFDIDAERLNDSFVMLENINRNYHGKAVVKKYTDRREALRGSRFIVNAVQVGGYEPCTIWDFEIPKKYGLRQTIGDTLGIGGIFRALRTMKVLDGFAADIHDVCPDALFINYTNPMSALTGYLQSVLQLKAVGLCHSVQVCVKMLLEELGMGEYFGGVKSKIAGINHQAWLLEICDGEGNDLYPEIKRRSASGKYDLQRNLVRHEIMRRFGYYNTESSEHTAEYSPYFIKDKYPELIERFHIPLDEYPRRCVQQIEDWKALREKVVNEKVEHEVSKEYAAKIIDSVINNTPYTVHGNVLNRGLITNLPQNACVEVPCLVDRGEIQPCVVGALPEQLAGLNRMSINPQLMTIQAAVDHRKDSVYQAAMLDAHTAAELSIDDIVKMCDEFFAVEKDWLYDFR